MQAAPTTHTHTQQAQQEASRRALLMIIDPLRNCVKAKNKKLFFDDLYRSLAARVSSAACWHI